MEALVAELREELAAYKGNAADEAQATARLERVHALRKKIIRSVGRGGHALSAARVLLYLIDHPGRLRSSVQIAAHLADAGAEDELTEASLATIKVYMTTVRKALRAWRLDAELETVFGEGYRLKRDAALLLAHWIEAAVND